MYQALYRKYRPSTFDEVVGQTVIVKTLKNAILHSKLTHAYLFTGPRGTGKTSIAKILAKTINCENLNGILPCNKCVSCTQINNKQTTDIIEIDAASNTGVDQIRELKSKINLVPATSKYKVYIIDEVHMLSDSAFNALLKTLEELFYFKEACERKTFENSDDIEYKTTMETFFKTIEECRKIGIEVDEVSFDIELLEAIFPVYFSISCAEATSNNANLTGIPFGSRIDGKNYEELMIKTRTEGFSELIKRRFIIGSFILQKENQEKLFRNAGRVRRMIVDKMHELFKEYDGLIMPASSGVAPFPDSTSDKLSDRYLILENHLAIGNFGGFPSITIPNGFVNGLPIAINITGEIKTDDVVLNIANKIEEQLGFKGIVAKESEEDV